MIYGNNVTLRIKNNNIWQTILDNLNFEITKNRITSFIGNNGSGKTSLLRCVANLQNKYTGKIKLDEIDIKDIKNHEQAKKIGFVFQDFNLFNNLTIVENIILPFINLYKIPNALAQKKSNDLLEKFGIENCKNLYPTKLSHGQRQKAAIIRSIILEPSLLILDEPTASLDLESSENLAKILLELNANGVTLALTSHDSNFISLVLDRAYYLENGKIVNFTDKLNIENEK